MSEHFKVRELKPDDFAFVFATWLQSYRVDGYDVKLVKPEVFFHQHRRAIERVLSRPTTEALVAHMTGEPDVIFGYLILERVDEFVVHYAFTKEAFRRAGIQKALMEHAKAPKRYLASHWTSAVDWLLRPQENVLFDPYRIL